MNSFVNQYTSPDGKFSLKGIVCIDPTDGITVPDIEPPVSLNIKPARKRLKVCCGKQVTVVAEPGWRVVLKCSGCPRRRSSLSA